ncbi:hypothetical protein JZ751_012765, partial [Albula glossodonta]
MQISGAIILLSLTQAYALPLLTEEAKKADSWQLAEKYLNRFYSLPEGLQRTEKAADTIRQKVKEMQAFFRLNVTGNLDPSTLGLMSMSRFSHLFLLPRVVNYTPDLPKLKVDQAIRKALTVWSKVTPLVFKRVRRGIADIMISFSSRDHGDGSPFDGPENLLAHAFPPGEGLGGDVHFDEDENWTADSAEYNLFLVAAHEFGHSLGLSHSTDPGALMYPNYVYTQEFPLSEVDIHAIQALYGIRMWAIDGYDLVEGYPKYIHHLGLPRSIREVSASVHIQETGKTLFFTGQEFWSYDESQGRMDTGYPRSIEDNFPAIGDKVDSVNYES